MREIKFSSTIHRIVRLFFVIVGNAGFLKTKHVYQLHVSNIKKNRKRNAIRDHNIDINTVNTRTVVVL